MQLKSNDVTKNNSISNNAKILDSNKRDSKDIIENVSQHENEIKTNKISLDDLFQGELQEKKTKGNFSGLSTIEQRYIVTLLNKHQLNYKKMFWDGKLNYMQHTENTLRKMVTTFLNMNGDDRVVEIPANVIR